MQIRTKQWFPVDRLRAPTKFCARRFRDSVSVENGISESRKKRTPVAGFAITRLPKRRRRECPWMRPSAGVDFPAKSRKKSGRNGGFGCTRPRGTLRWPRTSKSLSSQLSDAFLKTGRDQVNGRQSISTFSAISRSREIS